MTLVGLGSLGAVVCDHLTMCGVRNWTLYDPDTLGPENLVKHPRSRRDLYKPKVALQRDWILDRNPTARVEIRESDVMATPSLDKDLTAADLVLCCVDSSAARDFINDKCVELQKPLIVGTVYRTGFGGEVMRIDAPNGACYQCLHQWALANDAILLDNAIKPTQEESDRIYGHGEVEFRLSGLSMDIAFIGLVMGKVALTALFPAEQERYPPMSWNYTIFGTRPRAGLISNYFEVRRFLLHPQKDCACQRVV